nr:hypothetical protein [Pseudomonas denitrificans (nom. rej.)]
MLIKQRLHRLALQFELIKDLNTSQLVSLYLPIIHKSIQPRIIENREAQNSRSGSDWRLNVDVVRPMKPELLHTPRHRIYVYASPAFRVKKSSITEVIWVMSPYIEVSAARHTEYIDEDFSCKNIFTFPGKRLHRFENPECFL